MRIIDILKDYNISQNVLKSAFPDDSELIDVIVAADNPSVEAQAVEEKMVDKYLDNIAIILEAKSKVKEAYVEKPLEVMKAVEVGEPVLEGDWGDFNIDLDAPLPDMDLDIDISEPTQEVSKETESLLYENFHIDTYQKIADLFSMAQGKRPEYIEPIPDLEHNNIVEKNKLTNIGGKIAELYNNGFVIGTHPFNYVSYTDRDIFPDARFEDKIIDMTYGVLYGVPFLASDDLYIKAPHNFNELKNAYYNYVKQMGDYLLNSNLVTAKLHCYEIKSIFYDYLGSVVFQVGDDYVKVSSLKYNYITSKFGETLFYQGVVSHADKKATIVFKKGEDIVAVMTSTDFSKVVGHEIKLNYVEKPVEFTDKIKLDFAAITLPTSYKEFLRRDKTPIIRFNIDDCRQEIIDLRRIQGDVIDEELKKEYSILIEDLKVLSELAFGMDATEEGVRMLAGGGEITIGDVKKRDTVYGYNKIGELVKAKVFDIKKNGKEKWISAKTEDGEILSGDINIFQLKNTNNQQHD